MAYQDVVSVRWRARYGWLTRNWAPASRSGVVVVGSMQVLLEALELGRTHDQAPLSIIARDSFRALAGSRARRSVSPEAAIA